MTRNDVLQTLSEFERSKGDQFGVVRIGLFGSAVRDDIADEGDVDVVVELANPDLLTLVGIRQDLEALLQRPVDVVRYRETMNVFLRQRIEREAIYV